MNYLQWKDFRQSGVLYNEGVCATHYSITENWLKHNTRVQ
jgi:hypothetical protein